MGKILIFTGIMAATAASTAAQTPTPQRINTNDLRHHIFVMEGALARAVQFGALQVNREMRSVSPELFSLAGDTSARGVYLDDYGVYFDVGVPVLRPSMVWSFKQIVERDDRNTRELINQLKQMSAAARGPAERRTIENTVARLEAALNPAGAAEPVATMPPEDPAVAGPERVPPTPQPPTAQVNIPPRIVPNPLILKDPNRAYTEAVQRALIDAMIDFSGPILIAPNEWLTVAARDNAPRDILAPQDPFDEVVTILLRIKGEDLAAYRAGKIDREEAKKRVQVREF